MPYRGSFRPVLLAAIVAAAIAQPKCLMGQATFESMQVVPASFQTGAPLHVVGTGLDQNRLDLADQVILMNASDKMIVSCRLGWIYRRANELESTGPWAVGRPIELRLNPNSLATVGSQGIGFNAARDVFKKNGIAKGEVVVGVVEVGFQDGTSWTYPLAQKGRFEVKQDPNLGERLRVLLEAEKAKKGPTAKAIQDGPSGCPGC